MVTWSITAGHPIMAFVGRTVTAARTAATRASSRAVGAVRNMGGHGSAEDIYQSKEMWYKTTLLAAGVVIVPYTVFTVYQESHHGHHEKVDYPHMHIRHKQFPWKENDCGLFDAHCKAEWRHSHK